MSYLLRKGTGGEPRREARWAANGKDAGVRVPKPVGHGAAGHSSLVLMSVGIQPGKDSCEGGTEWMVQGMLEPASGISEEQDSGGAMFTHHLPRVLLTAVSVLLGFHVASV